MTTIDALPYLDVSTPAYAAHDILVTSPLRERSALARTDVGVQVLTYAGCERALLDERLVHGGQAVFARSVGSTAKVKTAGRTLTGSEGPDHVALRRVLQPWFTPGNVERVRVQTASLVGERLRDLAGRAEIELMGDVVSDVSSAVFASMIDVPLDEGRFLDRVSATLALGFRGDPADGPAIIGALKELRRYVDELIVRRRGQRGEDLVSVLVQGVEDGAITEADLHALLTELLAASTDNTTNSAGIVAWVLAGRPDVWAELRADPSLVPGAVEECSRIEPRVRILPMVVDQPTELCGIALDPGTFVSLDIAAAHHDPAAYEGPASLDIRRKGPRHLGFGVGRHHCLGAALARVELQAILGTLVEGWASIEPTADPDVVRTFETTVHRLPLRVAT